MIWSILKSASLFILANLILTQVPIHDFNPESALSWLLPLGLATGFLIYDYFHLACPRCDGNFALQRETTRRELIVERPALLKYRCRLCGENSYKEASYGGNGGGGGGC